MINGTGDKRSQQGQAIFSIPLLEVAFLLRMAWITGENGWRSPRPVVAKILLSAGVHLRVPVIGAAGAGHLWSDYWREGGYWGNWRTYEQYKSTELGMCLIMA